MTQGRLLSRLDRDRGLLLLVLEEAAQFKALCDDYEDPTRKDKVAAAAASWAAPPPDCCAPPLTPSAACTNCAASSLSYFGRRSTFVPCAWANSLSRVSAAACAAFISLRRSRAE